MNLSTKDLKEFKTVSSFVRSSENSEITSYLKFSNGVITKSNNESFVSMQSEFNGIALIGEKILFSFIDGVKEDFIVVEINDNIAVLSAGKEKMKCPTDDPIKFPADISGVTDSIDINSDQLKQFYIASLFLADLENMPYTSLVFINDDMVAASNGVSAYTIKQPSILPELIISKNTVNALKGFNFVSFSQADNYQIFSSGKYVFGFVKHEQKFISFLPHSIFPDGEDIENVNKSEIIAFCETCIKCWPGKPICCEIKDNVLMMVNSEYDYKKDLSFIVSDFVFNPAIMLKTLKSIPDDNVYFLKDGNKFYIKGDSGFVSVIMEMQK